MRDPRGLRTPHHRSFLVSRLGLMAGTLSIVVVLTAGLPASAGTQTSIVADPAGDTGFHAPGFMDMVRVEVAKTGRTFEFRRILAEPIPSVPPLLPPSQDRISWAWGLDTDPTTFPKGDPVAPGVSLAA